MATHKKVAKSWHKPFLEALRNLGSVRRACTIAEVHRATVWKARQSDPEFSAAYDEAVDDAVDVLEQEAWRRAAAGVERIRSVRTGTTSDGKPIFERIVEKEYSDTLLIFLLKGHRPERFRDNYDVAQLVQALRNQGTPPAPGPDAGASQA